MYRIGKSFRFEAGHHLPSLPEGHKCKRPHGHSYVVEVLLVSMTLNEFGFVVDYGKLDAFKQWIDATVDHRDLNEILPVETTAENLAKWFWDQLGRFLPENKLTQRVLYGIRVKETESTFAEYWNQ